MIKTKSSEWFGDSFARLDPLLQDLHVNGGKLSGPVSIEVNGRMGKRLAKKLGIPADNGSHTLQVNISHGDDGLHWDRCFDQSNQMKSVFKPVGDISNGYWIESTGAIRLHLMVDIKDGGWHWRCIKASVKGIKIPLWLFPTTTAYKVVENGSYRFYVGISLPVFGQVLSYSGLLGINDQI